MTTSKRRQLKIALVSILSLVLISSFNAPSNAFANTFISTEIPDYPGKEKLKAGVKNSSVKKVQEALIELGYEISSANVTDSSHRCLRAKAFVYAMVPNVAWRGPYGPTSHRLASSVKYIKLRDDPQIPSSHVPIGLDGLGRHAEIKV